MFALHPNNSSARTNPPAIPHKVKVQQPIRRVAFEVICQSKMHSTQSIKPRGNKETFSLILMGVLTRPSGQLPINLS